MSLLNQVLKDLETRGANGPLVDMPIRTVHAQARSYVWAYAAGGIALLGVAAVVWWMSSRQVAVVLPPVAAVLPVAATNPMPISPMLDASSPQAESQVAASGQADMQVAAAAPGLNPEPASPPLPISSHGKPLVALVEAAPVVEPPAAVVAKPDVPTKPLAGSKEKNPVAAPPAAIASKPVASVSIEPPASISKQLKPVSPQQQAENEFRKANLLAQQGRRQEAVAAYETALHLDPQHVMARETLVAVLLESRLNADAEKVLQDGLRQMPKQTRFAMLLARLQVDRNALSSALDTLEKTSLYADQHGDYQAFMGALLQRQNRHKEAITHYQIALQLSPNSGLWLMGFGISLQAVQRLEDARDAYKRAIETRSLSPELQAYIAQRMKEIK